MRWTFPSPTDTNEAAERLRIGKAIDAWWDAFGETVPQLNALFSGESDWDLPAWMDRYLRPIDPNLMWEFGPALSAGHRLVITPENLRHLRPLVAEVLRRAPHIPGWEF